MRRTPRVALLLFAACLVGPAGCGGGGDDGTGTMGPVGPVVVDLDAPPPDRLSAYHLFTWAPTTGFAFNARVVPYDLNTALFSDYALKQRAIYLPDGATASFQPDEALDLPVGSVVIKTFYFPADFRVPDENLTLIETRLLVRHADDWHPLPYIWDAAQDDAVLAPAGEVRAISFIDSAGTTQHANYLVPQRNECQNCHAEQDSPTSPVELVLLGVKARHINRAYDYGAEVGSRNQLERLGELGMLSGAPAPATIPAAYDFRPIEASGPGAVAPAELDAAARSYLDINCAHCHNP
ncbi:MAG TPA: hypothetical protein VHN14_22055, partial [Kofleriaceae bacterium]|nr:hypothetical protein [Kofleriaceae bacterium]